MMPRTRASFVGVRLAGAGWWVFESGRGRVVEPYRPGLAMALARVRMGEFVLDEGAARKIIDTMAGEADMLAVAKDANRRLPGEAVESGLRFKLDYYAGWRSMYAATLDAALASARRSLATGQWESLPDWDAKVTDQMRSNLDELVGLAEKTDVMGPPVVVRPRPTPGAGPVAPTPPTETGIIARIEALPAPAKVGLGVGAAAIMLGLGYAIFG